MLDIMTGEDIRYCVMAICGTAVLITIFLRMPE